jgi:hypothetical protein
VGNANLLPVAASGGKFLFTNPLAGHAHNSLETGGRTEVL